MNWILWQWIESNFYTQNIKHLMQNFAMDVVNHWTFPGIDWFVFDHTILWGQRVSANTSTTIRYCQPRIIAFESIHAILSIWMDLAQRDPKRKNRFLFWFAPKMVRFIFYFRVHISETISYGWGIDWILFGLSYKQGWTRTN